MQSSAKTRIEQQLDFAHSRCHERDCVHTLDKGCANSGDMRPVGRLRLAGRPGQVLGHTPEQRVAASTLRRYSFRLRLAIAQADARPAGHSLKKGFVAGRPLADGRCCATGGPTPQCLHSDTACRRQSLGAVLTPGEN